MFQKSSTTITRWNAQTTNSFDHVLSILESGIGRPDLARLREILSKDVSYSGFEELIHQTEGPSGLLEFLRLDLGAVLYRDPGVLVPYRMIRIIAGNPLTMKEMTRHTPEAGSYAPISILVFEQGEMTHLRYDTMESLLQPYGITEALTVARSLDASVIALMERAIAS